MSVQVFGPIITGSDVLDAVQDTIATWQTTYLAEIERRTDRTAQALPLIRNYTRTPDFAGWPEDQLPSCLLVCPGLENAPVQHADGTMDMTWSVGVAIVVSASTLAATNDLAKVYAAAIRTLLLQQPSLGGFAQGLSLTDESYDDMASDDGRSLAAGQVVFNVDVRSIGNAHMGLPAPPEDPYTDPQLPEVSTTTVDVEHVRPPANLPEED